METFKTKLKAELEKLFWYFLFFALFLCAFTLYGLLILKEHHMLGVYKFGYAILEALLLSKLIILGENFHLGEKYNDRALIYPTLYKTIIFSIFVIVMSFVEESVMGWLRGKPASEAFEHIFDQDIYTILAKALVMGFVFFLFFAFTETARTLGGTKLFDMFTKRAP